MFASSLAFICLTALAASDELNSSARMPCPPGWSLYKDNCFRVYKETKTWQEARALCMEQSDSADLVTIPDKGTTDFIIRNFDTNNDLDFWTGLNDIEEAGVYHWARGNVKLESYSYSDWAPNQPNNIIMDTRCVHLWIYSGHGWADEDCTFKHSVLCEQPVVKEVHEWRVLVTTSNETGLQMNDAVHMRIIGTKGKSQPVELNTFETDDFEMGSRDEYLVTIEDIGTPKDVQVWHDKSGSHSHSWHLSSIELQRTENNKTKFVFNCDCWLSEKHGDGRLERTIPLSNTGWNIVVVTSDLPNADTNTLISLKIIGSNGNSSVIRPDNPGDDFERNSHDEYFVTMEPIGTPIAIEVSHDESGADPSWHLARIELEWTGDPGTQYIFNCDCWLSSDHGDTKLGRTLPLSETYWEAQVITSNLESAGTKADVSLVIFGMKGHTRDIPVQYSTDNGQQLARGQTHLLRFWTVDIGMPTRMKVKAKYDNETVGWHLDKIGLKNMNGAETNFFECNCWIKMDGPSGETVIKELFWP